MPVHFERLQGLDLIRLATRLMRLFRRKYGVQHADAEDLAQEVLVKLLHRLTRDSASRIESPERIAMFLTRDIWHAFRGRSEGVPKGGVAIVEFSSEYAAAAATSGRGDPWSADRSLLLLLASISNHTDSVTREFLELSLEPDQTIEQIAVRMQISRRTAYYIRRRLILLLRRLSAQ